MSFLFSNDQLISEGKNTISYYAINLYLHNNLYYTSLTNLFCLKGARFSPSTAFFFYLFNWWIWELPGYVVQNEPWLCSPGCTHIQACATSGSSTAEILCVYQQTWLTSIFWEADYVTY